MVHCMDLQTQLPATWRPEWISNSTRKHARNYNSGKPKCVAAKARQRVHWYLST